VPGLISLPVILDMGIAPPRGVGEGSAGSNSGRVIPA
jgi:hypothetical protein